MIIPQRIAILGLGLIGSSLARALAEKLPDVHISGFDLSHETLVYAFKQGFIHTQHAHAGQAAHEADVIVIATPPSSFASLAADITPFLKAGAIVTDVGSVKRHAVTSIEAHIPEVTHYVPGHPIAGSEQTGARAGRPDLFSGKRVILTPRESDLKSEAVARIRAMWEAAGARAEYMPADLHDRIYAYVSHLPQLVAFAGNKALAGLSPADDEASVRALRLTKSDATLWADICMANSDYIETALSDFSAFAAQMEGELSETPAEVSPAGENTVNLYTQVVATCLIATASLLQELTGVHPARYAGSGFSDMTAPAISDPEAALAAISSHHQILAKMLKAMLTQLTKITETLKRGDKAMLEKVLGGN